MPNMHRGLRIIRIPISVSFYGRLSERALQANASHARAGAKHCSEEVFPETRLKAKKHICDPSAMKCVFVLQASSLATALGLGSDLLGLLL